ncbi:hypothetical protein FA13DRAFT_1904095 [Coprinellus micaceus]|uniref:Uncharacterized protein n=1 Tax=Coprinellus micaceus TaxID=71717 RepID=A0A4Y7TQD6_COPMI|nr:hypothetical protein FA13DRAFT_1904095 [Coprinellus micaceus]
MPLRALEVKNRITDMSFISYPPPKGNQQSTLMLGICTLEMDEYDSTIPIRSTYQLYTVKAPKGPPTSSSALVGPGPRRTFDGALTFVFPVSQNLGNADRLLFAGLVDVSSSTSKTYSRKKEVAIGLTRVLNAADLTDNVEWETTPLWSSSQRNGGIGVPISAGISPNEKQVWTSSFTIWHSYTTLNPLPQRHREVDHPLPDGLAIALAILARKSTSDILHSLSQATPPSDSVVDIITTALTALQKCERVPSVWITGSMMGVALSIYRSMAKHCEDEERRQRYTERWRAAHDMMSMVSCLTAFHEASKADFLKRLLKACVVATTVPNDKPSQGEDDLFGSTPNSPIAREQFDPVLINLIHPFALTALSTVLESIQKFKELVDRNALSGEDLAAGRHVLDDLVVTCPTQIPELLKVLSEAKVEAGELDGG